jgi:biotin carboxyl carrier protein
VDTGSTGDENMGADARRPMRSYDVAVEERGGSTTVYVDGHPIPVTIGGAAGRDGRRAPSAEQGFNGPRRIVAPMPGRIVKVLVKPGQAVAARQGLVVVEAMKMENELRAPGPGTVTDVKVTEGASVEANALLVVIS